MLETLRPEARDQSSNSPINMEWKKLKLIIVLFFYTVKIVSAEPSITCRNENDKPVDWFIIYKIPEIKEHPDPLIKAGSAYAFITSDGPQEWILSKKSINDSNSLPGHTLASLYNILSNNIPEDYLSVLYNDQPPEGNVSLTGGHTKGVVLGDQSGGVWLVHSVPHYPPPPQLNYSYPHTGLKNGQSFLCISMPPDQLDFVGTQLMFNYPHIYSSNPPSQHLAKLYPNLTQAAKGGDVKTPPWYHSQSLKSRDKVEFYSFAKSPEFHKDLYSAWVAPVLEVGLLVETWPNGAGRLPSYCQPPFKVENVESVNVSVVSEDFTSHKDHSKWAISDEKSSPWVCIGDINRASTQAQRGGGTVCMKNTQLWKTFSGSINKIESCP